MIVANHTSEFSKKERSPQDTDGLQTQADIEKQALATQNSLIRITNQIRKSLDFEVICETATQEMLDLLEADRVAIYQFNPDWSGQFIFEAAGSEWIPLVEAQQTNELISKNVSDCSVRLLDTHKNADTHLQATYGGSFVQGEVFRVCEDIENAGFSDCYIEVLKSYQARAYAIIAIYLDNQLWGLLAAYQNSGPRQWKESEVHVLFQVAEQLGIALKQAEYVTTIQKQTAELNETLEQLKQSQAQLVHGEKMASLGQLVAGIAHEVNNPINFIYANLSHVEAYVSDLLKLVHIQQQDQPQDQPQNEAAAKGQAALDREAADDLEFILEDLPKTIASMRSGSARIREIVLSLRNFSRLDESGVKQIDLHEGIESTLVILNHQLAANSKHSKIEINKDYGAISNIECDPAQLNQVFLAVLTNAVESLSRADNGEQPPQISIRTRMTEQGQVSICIQDNGPGVDDKYRTKIFDHFYTTKPVGEGAGLGLAIARQIVEDNHGGTLTLEANQTQGAAFVIQLPVSSQL
ncbi:MAG: ATP-binding protein [Cyanobacteria bacterium J06627_28]